MHTDAYEATRHDLRSGEVTKVAAQQQALQGRAGGEQGTEVALRDEDIHKAQLLEKRQVKRTGIFCIQEIAAAEGGDTKDGRDALHC